MVRRGIAVWSPAVFACIAFAQPSKLPDAGVCGRCHVSSALEWGVSVHSRWGVGCTDCHGGSSGHVADERNNVKPDRIARATAVAGLCAGCHERGCPRTRRRDSCQNCHHAHALLDPSTKPEARDEALERGIAQWRAYSELMAKGEHLVRGGDWRAAQDAFAGALELMPQSRLAREKLTLCRRRLDPELPGFSILSNRFDEATGLPFDVVVKDLGIEMVLIPGGEFDLGSERRPDTQPVHTVRVEPFYLAKFELTQERWQAVMGANPSLHQEPVRAEAGRMPVERVSWEDCQELVRRLNSRVAGGGFRLPTEAEWEFAARAGAAESLDFDQLLRVAWFRDNSAAPASLAGQPPDYARAFAPRPAGRLEPNRWGVFDMLGNVWEWCSSLYVPYPYNATDGREDGTRPGLRVLRGGSYVDSADGVDFAVRHGERPARRLRWNGVRLARSAPE